MNKYDLDVDEAKSYLDQADVLELLLEGEKSEIEPKWDDLARLHMLVKERKPFQILEFGSGFSTIVMASALYDNWEEYKKIISEKPDHETIKTWDKPSIISVESSEKWKKNSAKKIRDINLTEFSEIVFSSVKITEMKGQICHLYDDLPDLVPDFIYLDGPDPTTVEGNINGISFQNPRRTVMSADILKYESTLLPGFFMIVDGRSNNARFLNRVMQRNYNVNYHKSSDVTTFELNEPRLGKKNIYGWEAYNGKNVRFAGEKIH